ncbi:MAG TPA: hypothetical protein VNA57_00085 [Acidimicrobiales bacterium]|nr:hypothetical protein [Acidimicrobiales bacterium]
MPDPAIDAALMKPYISALVLEYTGTAPATALATLRRQIEKSLRRHRGDVVIVAPEISRGLTINPPSEPGDDTDSPTLDEVAGFVYRQTVKPTWLMADGPLVDTRHYPIVLMQRASLIAITAEPSVREALRRWTRSSPAPPFRMISPKFINDALLQGETRSLSLHGTHQRQRRKADSKNIHGPDLRSAMNPFEDSTFMFSSARAAVDEDTHKALQGVVGATPTSGNVWNRPSNSFTDFRSAIAEVLFDIETAMRGVGLEQPFPLLATEVHSLVGVHGAYEVGILGADEVRTLPGTDEGSVDAAELLEHAQLNVIGSPANPDFMLDVGFGATAGRLAVHVVHSQDILHFQIGIDGTPSDPLVLATIRDAVLAHTDYLTVFYGSGHAVGHGRITRQTIRSTPFPNWQWWPAGICEVMREKPDGDGVAMHQGIGTPGDKSIFAWVVENIGPGWLTCDDGPGEVADFVHLAPDHMLTLIPVKAAHSDSPSRQVSASAYEVVVGQAAKNIGFLDASELHNRLSAAHMVGRATWHDGVRQPDRTGFLAALAARPITASFRILIVQPHLLKSRYTQLQNPAMHSTEDYLRLQRLETLLNSARGSVVGLGGDLLVVGCG